MNTIALAAVGSVPVMLLQHLREPLRQAFGREIALAPAVPLSATTRDPIRQQHLSAALLDVLEHSLKPAWEHLVGVTAVDLFAPGLHFVFGEADPRRRLAVVSIHRLRAPEDQQRRLARRLLKEVMHELGHCYGLGHCNDPLCVMWFSNTVGETDRKRARLCRSHAAELGRATRQGEHLGAG